MEDLAKRAKSLASSLDQAAKKLDLKSEESKLIKLQEASQQPDFWQAREEAQKTMQQISQLQTKTQPWLDIDADLKEVTDLIKTGDDNLAAELAGQLTELESRYSTLAAELRYSGPYDHHNAILSLYAGAGGTDAQDWTQMLFRMYQRYFEKQQWSTRVLDQSPGEEAGLKSATLEVKGNNAYGRLKEEQGVHRLVRLSPFNSDNLRQTSFAKVEVLPEIEAADNIAIEPKDLRIDVYRSSGRGGQSVNTTDSAVRITHLPTALTVAIQNERSQQKNREIALTIIKSKLAALMEEQHQTKLNQLKGPSQSAEWGQQIRSYVLHPYKQVKDLRSGFESSDPERILDGDLDELLDTNLPA